MSSMHGQRANSRRSSRNASRNASAIYPNSGGFKTLNVHEEDDDDEGLEAFGHIDDDDEWSRSRREYQQQCETLGEDRFRRQSGSEGDEVEDDEDGENEDYQHYKHYWRELDEEEGDDYLYEQQQRVDDKFGEEEFEDEPKEETQADNLKLSKAYVEQVGETNVEKSKPQDDNGGYIREDLIMDNMDMKKNTQQSEFAKLTIMRNDAQTEENMIMQQQDEEKKEEKQQDDVDGAKKQGPSSDISATTITDNNKLQTPVMTTTHINNWQTGDAIEDDDVKLLDSISDLNEKLPEIYETANIVVNSAAVPAASTPAASATRPPTDNPEEDDSNVTKPTTTAEGTTMQTTFGMSAEEEKPVALSHTAGHHSKTGRTVNFAPDAYQNDEDADIDEDDDYDDEEIGRAHV